MTSLKQTIKEFLPNGLGAKGDEETSPTLYPQRPLHILLATSGSVASIKVPLIVNELLNYRNVEVQVVATTGSLHFYKKDEVERHERVRVWTDKDEWEQGWGEIGDPVLHIELRRWADVVLIAPLSANTLAKLSNGICDNILTSLLRALPTFVPVLLFPAMNTHMYSHPFTAKQLKIVQEELGYEVFGPIGKKLACGDIGMGAMFEWSDIVKLVAEKYGLVMRDSNQ
ncbi:phosphopantothenoylcysteine decarboxylase [Pseudohyphozyma bogoriensis]|nr:phosphopantothenoylcysteine decarboxylase [Pseudohyphozyma bogoriensis]